MSEAKQSAGDGTDGDGPPTDAVGDALRDELDDDERLLWHASPDPDGVRRMVWLLAAMQAVALVGGVGLFLSMGIFGPLTGGMFGIMAFGALSVDVVLYRYLTGVEAGATARRLVVVNDVPLVGGRETVTWDDVERIRARTAPLSLLTGAGTVQVDRGGRFGRILGTSKITIPFLSDTREQVRQLKAIREEHADATLAGG